MSIYNNLPHVAVPVCIGDLPAAVEDIAVIAANAAAKNIRVCGLVMYYDPEKQVLKLTESPAPTAVTQVKAGNEINNAQFLNKKTGGSSPSSTRNTKKFNPASILVDTCLVGSFDFHCRKGTPVLCVGEVQTWINSRLSEEHIRASQDTGRLDHANIDNDDDERMGHDVEAEHRDFFVVKATICKLVEDLDYGKYCQYVEIIRQKNSGHS